MVTVTYSVDAKLGVCGFLNDLVDRARFPTRPKAFNFIAEIEMR